MSGPVARNSVGAYPMTAAAAAATASPVTIVPDVSTGSIISVSTPAPALPTPPPPPTPPRIAAPTAVSAPLPPQILGLVDTLKRKAAQLRDQHAAISEQATPIIAEKKKIEAEAVALEQRRRANEQQFAGLGVEKQRLNQYLQQAQQALDTLSQTENMWQDAAEIVRGLQ